MIDRKLGRGLDYLIGDGPEALDEEIRQVEIEAIHPNPHQPRRSFDRDALEGLADSIRRNGILQPILLRMVEDRFEIVAGERRWRAARKAGLEVLPAIVKIVEDDRMLELALVENLQREDLDPIERAEAYRSYIESLHITQEQAARRLGKDRSTVANTMRLLDLSEEVRLLVSRGTISMGHARALLGLPDDAARESLARRVVIEGLSVRAVEQAVKAAGRPARPARPGSTAPAHVVELEGRLRERFGTRVRIQEKGDRGKLIIEYYSREDFDRIFELLEG